MKRVLFTLPIIFLLTNNLAQASVQFDQAEIYMEQNATDGDLEVVIKATGGAEGMTNLKVIAPNGRAVVDVKAGSKLGLRHFDFESPEPENDGSLQKDFPAGKYVFSGIFASGKKISSTSMLNHTLPLAAIFSFPKNDDKHVATENLTIQWVIKGDPESTIVVIEEEKTGEEIKAKLSGNTTSFKVPNGFMKPNTPYKMSIGTIAKNKNSSYVEIEIITAR